MTKSKSFEIVDASYIASAETPSQLKLPTYPEVAFVGRSNVGKSSLLNALTKKKGLARVSKTPGRTRSFNFFEISYRAVGEKEREKLYFVDLPGYGYAKVGRGLQRLWGRTVGEYVEGRHMLRRILLLIDIRREVQEEEEWVIERTKRSGLTIILTKTDKLSRGAAEAKRRAVAKQLSLPLEQVYFSSILKPERDETLKVFNNIISEL